MQRFTDKPLSEWMSGEGPEADIVISTRVRLARNLSAFPFPILATRNQRESVLKQVEKVIRDNPLPGDYTLHVLHMDDLNELEKRVLVEKHLVSKNLIEESISAAVILSQNEAISIMVNEEDHLRIQCIYPGLQIKEAWAMADKMDDYFEAHLDYAFDEKRGYLTSCPTNVGTGIRVSVMMHLPALVMTGQINRMLSAVTQVGLVVRGIYGEGSETLGNIFQVSNQITLGQSEEEIMENLNNVARQLIQHERYARQRLLNDSRVALEDRIGRSYGILRYAKVIDSKEAMQKLSDVRLGIDLGLLKNGSANLLSELMVMTQAGFLQQLAGRTLSPDERDYRRASLIRDRLRLMEGQKNA